MDSGTPSASIFRGQGRARSASDAPSTSSGFRSFNDPERIRDARPIILGAPIGPEMEVSSNFQFPKAGLTPSQIAFISSRESLGAFGYGPGVEPPSWERSSSDLLASSISSAPEPSTSTSLATPAILGRARGASTSSISGSPLSRPPTTLPTTEADLEVEAEPSAVERTCISTHPPPSGPPPLSVDTTNLPTSSSILAADESFSPREPVPSSPAPTYHSAAPTPVVRQTPHLPAIALLSATPTHSSHPSPVVDEGEARFSHNSYFGGERRMRDLSSQG
ncbi:hypothetical protein MNV49_006083 [Pseudohyphozyma bogoriensis]|nr:hypothetical protein MNV49_006083 [Pseudohyphozyma bogoriensis]